MVRITHKCYYQDHLGLEVMRRPLPSANPILSLLNGFQAVFWIGHVNLAFCWSECRAQKCAQESKKLREYSKLQPHAKHKHLKNANNIFWFVVLSLVCSVQCAPKLNANKCVDKPKPKKYCTRKMKKKKKSKAKANRRSKSQHADPNIFVAIAKAW